MWDSDWERDCRGVGDGPGGGLGLGEKSGPEARVRWALGPILCLGRRWKGLPDGRTGPVVPGVARGPFTVSSLRGIPLSPSSLCWQDSGVPCSLRLTHVLSQPPGLGADLGWPWCPSRGQAWLPFVFVSCHLGRNGVSKGLGRGPARRLAGWARVCQANRGQVLFKFWCGLVGPTRAGSPSGRISEVAG